MSSAPLPAPHWAPPSSLRTLVVVELADRRSSDKHPSEVGSLPHPAGRSGPLGLASAREKKKEMEKENGKRKRGLKKNKFGYDNMLTIASRQPGSIWSGFHHGGSPETYVVHLPELIEPHGTGALGAIRSLVIPSSCLL